jgi:hypothetical protein
VYGEGHGDELREIERLKMKEIKDVWNFKKNMQKVVGPMVKEFKKKCDGRKKRVVV